MIDKHEFVIDAYESQLKAMEDYVRELELNYLALGAKDLPQSRKGIQRKHLHYWDSFASKVMIHNKRESLKEDPWLRTELESYDSLLRDMLFVDDDKKYERCGCDTITTGTIKIRYTSKHEKA